MIMITLEKQCGSLRCCCSCCTSRNGFYFKYNVFHNSL